MSDEVVDGSAIALDSPTGRLVIATTVLGSSVVMIIATVVNVALPAIAADLGASSAAQTWIVNGYLLAVSALILVGGTLGDRYGQVRIFRLGVAWFAVASLACALAPTTSALIAFRLLQGVGGALLTPGSLAIIESLLQRRDRGRAVGMWSGLGGIAGAIGPLIGGALVDFSWRWIFVIVLPLCAVVLLLAARLPEAPRVDVASIDIVGAVLAVLALGGITFALIEGPDGGWTAPEVAAGVLGLLAGLLAVIYEPRVEHPMVPVDLFSIRPFTAANVITFLVYGGMGVVFFLLPLQLQVVAGWTPVESGAALLPVTVILLFLSSRAGDLAQRIGPRIPLTVGPLVMAGGTLLLATLGPDAEFVDLLPGVVVFGLGLAAAVAPVTSTALGSVPDARAGAASGTNNAIARTGQLLAIAAVPGLAGLTGGALADATQLDDGYDTAMIISAALVAAGGVAAALLLRSGDACGEPDVPTPRSCPVDGVPLGVGAARSDARE